VQCASSRSDRCAYVQPIARRRRVNERASHEATACHDQYSMDTASAGLECLDSDHAPACPPAPGSCGECTGRTRTGSTTRCLSVRQSSHSGNGRWRRRARTLPDPVMRRSNPRLIQTVIVSLRLCPTTKSHDWLAAFWPPHVPQEAALVGAWTSWFAPSWHERDVGLGRAYRTDFPK